MAAEPAVCGNPRRNFGVPLGEITALFKLPELDLERTEELPSYDDRNFRVFAKQHEGETGKEEESRCRSWVLKCMHAEHISEARVLFQVEAIRCLHRNGVPVPAVVGTAVQEGKVLHTWTLTEEKKQEIDSKQLRLMPDGMPAASFVAHVIDFVDKSVLYPELLPKSPKFLRHLGGIVGQVSKGMLDFFESGEKGAFLQETGSFTWDWSASEIPRVVADRTSLVPDAGQREKLEMLLKRVGQVLPLDQGRVKELEQQWAQQHGEHSESGPFLKLNPFRRGFVHTDLNDTNVLFSTCSLEKDEYETSAVLDFGDSCVDYPIFDVGIAAAYACMHQTGEVIDTIALVCRGYVEYLAAHCPPPSGSALPFSEALFDVLLPYEALRMVYALALGRLLLSFAMGAEQMVLCPGDEYVAHTVKPTWEAAEKHLALSESLEDTIALLRERALKA